MAQGAKSTFDLSCRIEESNICPPFFLLYIQRLNCGVAAFCGPTQMNGYVQIIFLNILFAIISPATIQMVIVTNAAGLLLPKTTTEKTAPAIPKINPRPALFAFVLDTVVPENTTL
jgi:hypothetical protein